LDGNIFQETLWHIISNVPPVFSINTVNDPEGKALKVFSGPVKDVFKKGAEFAKKVFEVEAKTQADIAVCGIGRPKDINLYQASRAINYVLNVDRPVVKKGGVLIVAAELGEGIGQSAAEKRFYEELKSMASARGFVDRVKTEGCIAGEHRAYMVAKALLDYNIIFVSKGNLGFMKNLPIEYYEDMGLALSRAQGIAGRGSKAYVIPHALTTIAKLDYA